MSSVFLDIRTLSLVLMLTTAFLSVVMLLIWRVHKTYAGFGFWTLANFTIALGFLLLSLRGTIPDFLTVIVANTLMVIGLLLCFEGNRKFLGLADSRWFSLNILALHALALGYFTYIDQNVIVRIIIVSLFTAIVSGRNAFVFSRNMPPQANSIYKFASATYFAFTLLILLRAFLTFEFSHINDLYAPDWIQSIVLLIFIIFAVAWTFNYIVLSSDRFQSELKETQAELKKQATTDFLTGINNDRRFFEIGTSEIQRATRFRNSLAVIMFDLDFFKCVNDEYGHAAGDKVLIEITRICQNTLRVTDTFGRIGGEEFAVLLPHTDVDGAKIVAEYLRVAIEDAEIEISSETIKITASFGVSEFKPTDAEIKEILDRADAALYEAKRNGRNQAVADSAEIIYKKLALV